MSVVYIWLPVGSPAKSTEVLRRMERTLRASREQRASSWSLGAVNLGVLEPGWCDRSSAPARVGERYTLWVAGEIFDGGSVVEGAGVEDCQSLEFKQNLLESLLDGGLDRLKSLDGEYVIMLWDGLTQTLTIVNDRFGGLPLYWGRSRHGIAVAGGVRGVLAATEVSPEPDAEALREAVTFGGYRLGSRTNVRGVEMIPGGTIVSVRDGALQKRRYWRYANVGEVEPRPVPELVEEAAVRWIRAIRLRMGDEKPGQTLSGGLDSRAILAEAAPRARQWTALTYGIPGCDDARFGRRAAEAAGVSWLFYNLYSDEGWLDRRAAFIQETDGLIELGDLMHVETISLQKQIMDVHFSGYIGDVVCSTTYADITSPEDLYRQLPFYGTGLGMSGDAAHEKILDMVRRLDGVSPRFAIFEHKFPQSTNRWTAAWRPWIRVRKPFLDYKLFDFWQGLPISIRTQDHLYERCLRARYPRFFARIPNQQTGVPVLTPEWRRQVTRVSRYAVRRTKRALGLSAPSRSYHDDLGHLGARGREQIERVLLAPDALCGEILGREPVQRVVRAWLDRGEAPSQVIGAMYVYELYHGGLGAHLRATASD